MARIARRRLRALILLVLLSFTGISWRLVEIQAFSGERFSRMALDQRLATLPLPAERGSIFDRNGRDLAISVQRDTVWADPSVVVDPAGYATQLAPIVSVDEQVLLSRLSRRDRRFVYIARAVDDEVADAVRALDLPGVGFLPESRRHYPGGALAAPVLGRVGGEGYGLDGLENLYDEMLAGKPGELEAERDTRGVEIPRTVRNRVEPERGTDLVLTVDQALQHQVEQSLADQVTATSAKGGVAVVVDVRAGDVLAMATVDADPTTGRGLPAGPGTRNRPMTDVFEPGSTNKVVTIASAIDHGVVGPYTPFDVPGWITVGDRTFTDHDGHPTERWSTTDILRESSNVGTIMIAQHLGKERLDAALRAFGLGAPTAAEFPGQASGILLPVDRYYSSGIGSVPIGYGVAVSALQMLEVYVTVANDGVTQPPRLVGATIDGDGTRHPRPVPEGQRVIRTETATAVTEMLTQVVEGGTGTCAAVPGYTVAGKTGTSRKPHPDGSGYANDRHLASFIGFAPADSPRLAAIVVLDEPVQMYGGRAAAPVFSEIMQFALRLYRVAPPSTSSDQWEAARAKVEQEGVDCTIPHGAALDELLETPGGSHDTNGAARSGASTLAPPTSSPNG